MYAPFISSGLPWFPNAAKINCLEPRSVGHEMKMSQNQRTIALDNETLRRNEEMDRPGLTALIISGLSFGKRDASSLAKKRFRSLIRGNATPSASRR